MIEEGGLEIRLAIPGPFGELREFKNVRIVAIEAGESCELARRMTDSLSVERPVRSYRRDPIWRWTWRRSTSVREDIVDTDQFNEMRPGEP